MQPTTAISNYRDLLVWQRAMDLADLVYDITDKFPPGERFGLTQQMRRSAVSIPSNIAEGHRHRTAGYIHRLTIALGEHAELETQFLIAERRGFPPVDPRAMFWTLSVSVVQLGQALLRSLEARYRADLRRRRRRRRALGTGHRAPGIGNRGPGTGQ